MKSRKSLFVIAVCILTSLAIPGQAQTYTVLHNFTDGSDGGAPAAGVTIDRSGYNLYGTAQQGGGGGAGIVFRLQHKGGGWVFSPLYSFSGLADGGQPLAGVAFGPSGSLYGTTYNGANGTGTVFDVQPSPSICSAELCAWHETVLHRFGVYGASDGAYPSGDLVFDSSGNLYGTTSEGGSSPYLAGTVYKLVPSGSHWIEQVIYNFDPSNGEGVGPASGVILDQNGNLYGTTAQGGAYGCGDVYELTPSDSGWTRSLVYAFHCDTDGAYPVGGLLFDPAGNLYGTTSQGGSGQGGTAFKLTPSTGSWVFSLLYSFTGIVGYDGPTGKLAMDASGNIYGTRAFGLPDFNGSVFKLTPSNGGWTYTSLHDFAGGSDGANPVGDIARDASGKLYGTTYIGGASARGTVWQITP